MTKTIAVMGIALLLAALVPVPAMIVCAIVTLMAPAIVVVRRDAFVTVRAPQSLALFAVALFRGPPA